MTESAYRTWRTYSAKVAGRTYEVATKAGAFAHGRLDPAAILLAAHVDVAPGDTVVHLNCGNGLTGAVAALAAPETRVYLTDRNIVSVEAARRTLDANHITAGGVFLGHGTYVLPADLRADSVVIRIPQERVALLQLLADAFAILRPAGRCYIAGATNEGIKTAARTIETMFGNARVLSRDSSHRVVSAVKRASEPVMPDDVDPTILDRDAYREIDATLRGKAYRLCSRPGVFSWEHVDEATALLADVMDIPQGVSVLDLGCGSGALGLVASSLSGGGRVTMVDADIEAGPCDADVGNAVVASSTNLHRRSTIAEQLCPATAGPPENGQFRTGGTKAEPILGSDECRISDRPTQMQGGHGWSHWRVA